VTTQLEMEAGVYPVEGWYQQRAGKSPVNYGATVGHIPVRIATMVDLASIGLTEQDLAIGLLNNPHFDAIAAQRNWAQEAGSGGSRVPLILEMIDSAQQQGIDVTTEVYPYTAWSTFIGAAIFDGDFTRRLGLGYSDIELPESGERLDQQRFETLRAQAPQTIIVGHGMQEDNVTAAVSHPGVMIASDGMFYSDGRAHPRGAGTFSRVLGYYVRKKQALSLMEALGKMSYLPARRLEKAVPQMKHKGRIEVGADADVVVFDPESVADRATFAEPALPSKGIEHVLVNGVFVVRDGQAQRDSNPGRPIRRE
jgi:dihydroorotase